MLTCRYIFIVHRFGSQGHRMIPSLNSLLEPRGLERRTWAFDELADFRWRRRQSLRRMEAVRDFEARPKRTTVYAFALRVSRIDVCQNSERVSGHPAIGARSRRLRMRLQYRARAILESQLCRYCRVGPGPVQSPICRFLSSGFLASPASRSSWQELNVHRLQ